MKAKDQNIALLNVAEGANKNPRWKDYAQYCYYREKGLRKEAFQFLNKFLKASEAWILKDRIEFVKFLISNFETVKEADFGLFPQPLSEKLVKPTLEEWTENEENDSAPFRWYGKYYRSGKHLNKALEINPYDDQTRVVWLNWLTYNIYSAVHHLPDGYIGDPIEDLETAKTIQEHIDKLSDDEHRKYWQKELDEDLELVKNYIEWKNSDDPDLSQWGLENNKKVGYGLSRSYYYKK